MTRRLPGPSRRRSRPDRARRPGDESPCQLMCSSGKPGVVPIASYLVCEPCAKKTREILADAEGISLRRMPRTIPRALAAIERGGAR